jgi:hypothetical protein
MSQLSKSLSISFVIPVPNISDTNTEIVFPDESFTSPFDSTYEQKNSPPTVNHLRNRVISYSFYDKNGNIPSVFLLPCLEETPTRKMNSTMQLNFRLRSRIYLPSNAVITTKGTMKINKSDDASKPINLIDLGANESHQGRKMTRRLSNSAHAA